MTTTDGSSGFHSKGPEHERRLSRSSARLRLSPDALVGAKLALDGTSLVERLDETGVWTTVGHAPGLTLPAIQGWDVGVFRIRRNVK